MPGRISLPFICLYKFRTKIPVHNNKNQYNVITLLGYRMCHTRNRKKPQYGDRFLKDTSKVFNFNAWDNVEWDSEQEALALDKIKTNSTVKLSVEDINKYETEADRHWDCFYSLHQNRFFKDRHWLFTEFPEINPSGDEQFKILEIGCGVGNTVFPILEQLKEKNVFVYGCDFSTTAVNLLKEHTLYNETKVKGFVCDVTSEDWDAPFEENSLDVILMVFVLSAVNPNRHAHVVKKALQYLKPGGVVLFRDYGRYDLAQLRFKNGRCLSDNFYVRGDGTRVYFFTQEEVKELFSNVGFTETQNLADRRLQVNRGKLLKMYRVWIQAKYQKPISES